MEFPRLWSRRQGAIGGLMPGKTEKMTPAFKRLVLERMAQLTVERADKGHGATAGVAKRILDNKIGSDFRDAFEWANAAVRAVRQSPGGEEYKTDEAVAVELMRQIDERKASHSSPVR